MNRDELLKDLDLATRAGDIELARVIDRKLDDLKRTDVASGITMKVGPFDTGLQMPQWMTEGLAGMGRRFTDIATLGNREKDETTDRLLDQSTAATVGGAGADLATLLGGGAVLRGASALPQLGRAAPVLRTVGQNMMAPTSIRNAALTAGTYGAATESGGVADRAKAGALNAAMGAAGQAIPMAIGGAIRPNVSAENVDLLRRGIRLTPGQMAGGAFNAAEQKATSIPLLGDAIAGARRRSVEDFNRAVANEVLQPLGMRTNAAAGRGLVNEVQNAVSNAYDDVLPRLGTAFGQSTDEAIDAGRRIAAEAGLAGRFDEILRNRFFSRVDANSQLTGEQFKLADSALARLARENRLSSDSNSRALGQALETVRSGLRADLIGSANDIARLKATDSAYAKLVRMETAAGMRGAKDGVFTPAQFGNATERGASRSAKASGRELMGDFADTAERVIGNAYPDSGTAGRAMLGGGLLGFLDPTYLAGGLLASSAYTRPGQAVMRAAATARPAALQAPADAVRSLAPYGGLLAPQLFPIYAGQQ